ncbi:Thiol-disulfide oxidoreductase ResA [Planctomycetes bacterium MalM25]|nr:Thiol-disulfide oxidoreductase ResA [Planctomycetes bacterium MalM25]
MLIPRPLLVAALVACLTGLASADSEMLTIGSSAPQLDVDHWFALGEAPEGEEPEAPAPITAFESGKVYVVEFWATWCGPCVGSIPHIHELQERYRDQGVTVISLSDESVDTIEPFFEREVRGYPTEEGEETPTYGELMGAYRVGTDPDGSVNKSYMQAAMQNGIPCAFLVGKSGVVEWIGHPMEMEPVLNAVLDESWDREEFGEQFRLQQEMEKLQSEAIAAARAGDFKKLREKAETLAESASSPRMKQMAQRLLMFADQIESQHIIQTDPERAIGEFNKLVESANGDVEAINRLTWGIYGMAASGVPIREDLLQAAAEATEELVVDDAPNGNLLDTIGHLYHQMGDLDKAIEVQRRAVAVGQPPEAAQLQAQIEAFLQQLLAEKAAKAEAPAE